jgi:hypothetical protein
MCLWRGIVDRVKKRRDLLTCPFRAPRDPVGNDGFGARVRSVDSDVSERNRRARAESLLAVSRRSTRAVRGGGRFDGGAE